MSDQPLSDVVALTAEYCAAVGAYPASAPLAVEEVVYLTEVRFTFHNEKIIIGTKLIKRETSKVNNPAYRCICSQQVLANLLDQWFYSQMTGGQP